MRRLPIPKNAWLDIALLSAILLSLNLLFARHNPGWLDWQPTPWLLLPLLAGARFGLPAGIAGGLAAFALVGSLRWPELRPGDSSLLLWSVLVGAVSGGFRPPRQSPSERSRNEEALRLLNEEVLALRKSKGELDALMALRHREQSTLDSGLRWLSASHPQKLASNTLLLLNRQARVTDAALYYFESESGYLHREALIGREDHLPPRLNPYEIALAREALERGEIIAVPELARLAPEAPQHHLIAIPFQTGQCEPFGLLLVTGMPCLAFTPRAVQLLGIICKWAAGFIEIKDRSLGCYRIVEGSAASRKIYRPGFFRSLVRLSAEAFEKQQLRSTLVVYAVPTAPKSFQSALESALTPHFRTSDYPAQLDLEFPHLAVLLPLTNEHGACIAIERCLAAWQPSEHPNHPLEAYKILLKQEDDLAELLGRARARHQSASPKGLPRLANTKR